MQVRSHDHVVRFVENKHFERCLWENQSGTVYFHQTNIRYQSNHWSSSH